MPSELCDERTASLLGWINAARRSSITPEHLIACAQLVQWYMFGLTEGKYKHSATGNVKVSDVGSSSTVLSAPTLLDLLNDDDVSPEDVNREALEEALFDRPDPYDLDETDRFDATLSADTSNSGPRVYRSSVRWAAAEYVKLDSPALKNLISPPKDQGADAQPVSVTHKPAAAAEEEDWDVEDEI
ncbi:hypothetical protein DFH07DRAFT_19691 [Mycena maculata]|uniref:Uncharacterized protein n=1 Tax=Mycena maculata TaxID=230809 RepID=A0AAD7ILJ6_9AGAR|nr:hypothetical protein DFH07DRAFT_19691 [Mycena maculata]